MRTKNRKRTAGNDDVCYNISNQVDIVNALTNTAKTRISNPFFSSGDFVDYLTNNDESVIIN